MKRTILALVGLSLVLAAVAAACTDEKEVRVVETVIVEREVVVEVEKEVIATAMPVSKGIAVEQAKYGGELKITAQGSIKSLDVGFSPAYVSYAVGTHIYEYPFGLDQSYNPQPQAVDEFSLSADGLTWTFKLREGLAFSNGNPVNADTMINSYPRWIDGSGGGKFVDEYLAPNGMKKTDNLTWTMAFTRSIGGVPDIMGWMYRGFWIFDEAMAAKPAGEDASEGDIANLVGSGPYKIEEWLVGDHVTLVRNEGYIPRAEPGSYTAGGKRAYIDKLTWIEIPAEETKIAGLRTSEWDVVDGAGLDHFFPLNEDPDINVSTYPFHKSFLGISHKEPPTDSQKIRQAILVALDWEALMAGIGPSELWFLCPAIYYCNTPLETDIGASEWYSQHDIPRAKALLEEGGYAGETIFIMNPADYATIAPLGPVLKAQMEDIGLTTEMPGMDWSTLVSKIYDLGWNLFTSWSTHNGFGSPIHDLNNVDGGTGYGGGFTFPDQIEARKEFAFAATPAEQMVAVEKLQMAYFINVPRIYGGQWSSIFPYRNYIKNFTTPSYPMYMHAWIEK
jgi:peptide/nickel transport system substrate-binding protein